MASATLAIIADSAPVHPVARFGGLAPDASPRVVARVATVAFQDIDVIDISLKVQMPPCLPALTMVGLSDKAGELDAI